MEGMIWQLFVPERKFVVFNSSQIAYSHRLRGMKFEMNKNPNIEANTIPECAQFLSPDK